MEIEKISERFGKGAFNYDQQRRIFIPCFDEYYDASIHFLTTFRKDFGSVLDLGAGTGLFTKYVYEQYPEAHYTLVDVAEPMLDLARDRFAEMKNVDYLVADYSQHFPGGKYDLVTSALSIHHLDHDQKERLYRNIYESLPANGVFLNLDQFIASSREVEEAYVCWWHNFVRHHIPSENEMQQFLNRRELDREQTLEETMRVLNQTGFRKVECVYNFMKFGVIVAVK